MKILYLGSSRKGCTSYHRAKSLERLGHRVIIEDPYVFFKAHLENSIISRFHYITGYKFLQLLMVSWINDVISKNYSPDVCWIDNGELFGHLTVKRLKETGVKIILYNHDDPMGGRDGHRFDSFLKTIPLYDLCVVFRSVNVIEYYEAGAKKIVKLMMSYDEVEHAPLKFSEKIEKCYNSDVVFIGTWMRHEGRDKFLLKLIESGINVKIWGNRWEKSPYWSQLKKYVAGGALSGRDYVAAIQGAKVCLGLLSKGNRDLHTTRSMEIPYAGGVLCAQRTAEHLELYEEDVEAVFWDDVDECISKCKNLLSDNQLRESIRTAGMQRVRNNKSGHEDQCRIILNMLSELN